MNNIAGNSLIKKLCISFLLIILFSFHGISQITIGGTTLGKPSPEVNKTVTIRSIYNATGLSFQMKTLLNSDNICIGVFLNRKGWLTPVQIAKLKKSLEENYGGNFGDYVDADPYGFHLIYILNTQGCEIMVSLTDHDDDNELFNVDVSARHVSLFSKYYEDNH